MIAPPCYSQKEVGALNTLGEEMGFSFGYQEQCSCTRKWGIVDAHSQKRHALHEDCVKYTESFLYYLSDEVKKMQESIVDHAYHFRLNDTLYEWYHANAEMLHGYCELLLCFGHN